MQQLKKRVTKARPERARPKNKTLDTSMKCVQSEAKPDLVLITREQTGVLFAMQKNKTPETRAKRTDWSFICNAKK
jgi:hypothetical protein